MDSRLRMLLKLRLLKLRRKRLLLSLLIKQRSYQRGLHGDRNFRGEFARIVTEMRTSDPEIFFSYFRMDRAAFDEILELVRPLITHRPTHRTPIPPEQRLVITLRSAKFSQIH